VDSHVSSQNTVNYSSPELFLFLWCLVLCKIIAVILQDSKCLSGMVVFLNGDVIVGQSSASLSIYMIVVIKAIMFKIVAKGSNDEG
jgi:hypothetical protein